MVFDANVFRKSYGREREFMEVILDKTKYDEIWNKIYDEYGFQPSPHSHDKNEWIRFPIYYVRFKLNSVWSEEQEQIVNSIMKKVVNEEMYALDWRHDCLVFHPNENIPLYYSYYDETRGVNVYFPSYYPNGDYYFFVKMDWSCGLFGHPWRQEICVVGEALIQEFEKEKERLDIEVIGDIMDRKEGETWRGIKIGLCLCWLLHIWVFGRFR